LRRIIPGLGVTNFFQAVLQTLSVLPVGLKVFLR
jgi:hypothetical protein